MLELALPFRVGPKRMAELRFAFGLDGEHFPGVIEDGGDGIFFGARPFCVREQAERRRFLPDADVTRNEISLFERDVEPRVVREFENERFLHFAVRRRHAGELKKTADAMFEMNDEIALLTRSRDAPTMPANSSCVTGSTNSSESPASCAWRSEVSC